MQLHILFRALRLHFGLLSAIPGGVGLYLSSGDLPLEKFLIVIAVLISGSGIAELINDYVDSSQDKFQKAKRIVFVSLSGGSGIAESGRLSGISVILATALLVGIVLLGGALLNVAVLVLSIVALFMALGYSLQPITFKSRGVLGVLDMALGRGLVSFHIGWLVSSSPTLFSLIVGMYISLLVFGTACLAYLADYPEDKQLRILTFPVSLGFQRSSRIAAASIALSLVLLIAAWCLSLVTVNLLILPFGALAFVLCRYMILDLREGEDLVSRMQAVGIVLVSIAPLVLL